MNPITLHEMVSTHNMLLQIKKPSQKIKAAITKLEHNIFEHIDGIVALKLPPRD